MAKLQAVVDSLEGIDEALHGLYVERDDGKYVLDAEGVEDVRGLKSALEKVKRDLREAKGKVPEDFDPDRWSKLLELEEEFQKGALTDKQREQFENLKQQMQEQHKKERGKDKERIERLEKALRQELVTARGTAALANAKGAVKMLLPHIERFATVVEQDGQYVPVITDERGNPRIGTDGENMTFDELVAEMRSSKDFASAFEGTGSSGGGAQRSTAGGGPKTVVAADDNAAFLANLEDIAKGKVEIQG